MFSTGETKCSPKGNKVFSTVEQSVLHRKTICFAGQNKPLPASTRQTAPFVTETKHV